MNESITIDQAELLFQLFIAQNADKKISDLFPSDEISKQVKIGTLVIEKRDFCVWLNDNHNELRPFEFCPGETFNTWDNYHEPWYSFDIMKYISLEDKV